MLKICNFPTAKRKPRHMESHTFIVMETILFSPCLSPVAGKELRACSAVAGHLTMAACIIARDQARPWPDRYHRSAPGLPGRFCEQLLLRRSQPPRNARGSRFCQRGHVKQRIAKHRRTRPTRVLARRHKGRKQRPFRIRHVTCVATAPPLIIASSGFSPGHRDLHSVSQPNRITTC